ncbi:unnamed protein product [Allacma fusca]|uniref:Uncharacterized protein n=1 Tax=Allacma fusca TaxID=39272 RepID=A0A8J2PVM1_9HEXA|nr:unnamed protein product [Allacma fusca]
MPGVSKLQKVQNCRNPHVKIIQTVKKRADENSNNPLTLHVANSQCKSLENAFDDYQGINIEGELSSAPDPTKWKQKCIRWCRQLSCISDARKLQYVKAAVRGGAQRVIHYISITDANYTVAWKALQERYEHKRELLYTQLNRLFSLKPVQPGVPSSLQELVDSVKDIVWALRGISRPVGPLVSVLDTPPIIRWPVPGLGKKDKGTNLPGTNLSSSFYIGNPELPWLCPGMEENSRRKTKAG